MTNGEAITELHMLQCRFHQIRKSDAAWEAIEMAKDALRAREKSKDDLVKHGKWISNGRNTCSGSRYKCSSCGHTTGYKHLRIYKFCPNCGAKMDGGDEDNG